MGKLRYDATSHVEFDDRVLAHLQLVIGSKLRRNESFWFTWTNPTAVGSGRVSIWVHPAIPIEISFAGSRSPAINREWIELLVLTANSPSGLRLVEEPTSNGDA